MTTSTKWAIRSVVLTALAITLWLCGPRAAAVLAARFARVDEQSPLVALDRVGFAAAPAWMDRPLLLAVAAALSPWLADEVPILDEGTAGRLRDGLLTVPWVASAALQREFPDRFRIEVELRRPVLAVRAADGSPLCLVDAEARMLPWVDSRLPVTRLFADGGWRTSMTVVPGALAEDARVRCAAAIAVEWRDELAPLVPECPELVEVDATNLGERWAVGPSYPEIRVALRRRDGASVVFAYGHPVDSPLLRVPVRTKANVLCNVLGKYPGLDGLVAGDLRFAVRWLDHVQPRPAGVRDPNENWKDLGPR